MRRDNTRDWGDDERPWSSKHKLASRVLKGAAIIGGSLLALRVAGPQLLRATEGALRRELSSAIGPGRRPGVLFSAFKHLGVLDRMPGLSWDEAGRLIPKKTEYEALGEWYQKHGTSTDGKLNSTHNMVLNAHGIRHLLGNMTNSAGVASDELMHATPGHQLRALRSFVSEATYNPHTLKGNWYEDSKWRPLKELHAQAGRNPAHFAGDMEQWVSEWKNEHNRASAVLSLTNNKGFDPDFKIAVGRIHAHKNILGKIFGLTEAKAETDTFNTLARHEQHQLEQQLNSHAKGVAPDQAWTDTVARNVPSHSSGMPEGSRIDPSVYYSDHHGMVDTRVTSAVIGGLWNEVKSGFQIPLVPYVKSYKPLNSGFLGNIGKTAHLTGKFNIGQIQPVLEKDNQAVIAPILNVGDKLIKVAPEYVDNKLTGYSATGIDGTFDKISANSAMGNRLADITGLSKSRDNWLSKLPGPIGQVLGKLGNMLDLGMQSEASEFEKQASRVTKFADPNYPGNLTKRIWSDPAEEEFTDAVAKKHSLENAFNAAGSLNKESPIYKELHALAGRAVTGGGLETAPELEQMHRAFAAEPIREIRSPKLKFMSAQTFDEIRSSKRTDDFRNAVAEEMMMRTLVDPDKAQSSILNFLNTGAMPTTAGASVDSLAAAFNNDLPVNKSAKSWMTGRMMANVEDINATFLLSNLRDPKNGSIVKTQLENYVYNKAFPALGEWLPRQDSAFEGTPFIAVRKGPNLLPDRHPENFETGAAKISITDTVYEMLANWNEHLHQLAKSRSTPEEITTSTVGPNSPFARATQINNHLSAIGLGLSSESLGSGPQALQNIALKRLLPIAAGTFYAGYASWEIRRLLYGKEADENGNAPGPIANLKAHIGIGWSFLKQISGVTNLQKNLLDFVPGLDNYLQPKTVREYKDYLKSGYDQVRQGAVGLSGLSRLNFFNDTPIYGGKTMFWRPSWYARAAADSEFSESGETRDEFYDRAWLPTPRHPFSTVKRLLDPYSWENMHEEDRPYPVTGDLLAGSSRYFGPLGQLAKPFESIVNATIGGILKPKQITDRIYDDLAEANEKIHSYASGGGYNGAPSYLHRLLGDTATSGWRIRGAAQKWIGGALTGGKSPYQGNYSSVGSGGTSGGWDGFTYGETPDDYNRDDVPQGGLLRSTPLGKNTLYQTTTNNLYERMAAINKQIHGKANVKRLGALEAYRRPKESNWWEPEDVQSGPSIGEKAAEVATSIAYVNGLTGQVNRIIKNITGEALLRGDAHSVGDPVARLESAELGYGGDRSRGVDYVNELPNRQPGWLPGSEGYVNFRQGDPFAKIADGETRLPGAGYEKLHDIKVLQTRASSLGKSVDDIMGGMLQIEQPMSKYAEDAADAGTKIHKQIQRRWVNSGIAESIETEMYNKADGISGHLDAILKLPEGRTVVDIKTVNDKRYRMALKRPFEEHLEQVNWYMHEKGIDKGAIMYLNRDNPEETTVKYFKYNQGRYRKSMNKVATARHRINEMMDDGDVQRGDLYDPLTRFKVLADVAPFSEQTKLVAHQLSEKLEPDTQEWKEFQATKDRLQKQKQSYNLYPYVFGKESSIVSHDATIARVIDANTFITEEDPEHPVKFAGIRVAQKMIGDTKVSKGIGGRLHRMAVEARRQFMGFDNKGPLRFFNRLGYVIEPGKNSRSEDAKDREGTELLTDPLVKLGKILYAGMKSPGKRDLEWDEALAQVGIKAGAKVHLEADPDYKKDSLNTERAIVYKGGRNVNRQLLDKNWARIQRDKYSPVQTKLFFSPLERMFGRLGESIAHADSPFNDKFLRARTPLEEYERGHLYGKTGGSWMHPFRDRIVPTVNRMFHQNPIAAALTGAFVAGAFWQTPGRQYETNILSGKFGIVNDKTRLAIMAAGAAVGFIGSTIVNTKHGPDNPWIPKHRRKEWEMQEYFDTLDYVKSKSLAKKYKELASDEEGVDVDKVLLKMRMRAVGNKRDRQALEYEKAELRKKGGKRTDSRIREINLALRNIAESETVQGLAPYAARAVAYEHAAEKTMYGMPAWATVGDRLVAIPRAHRQLISETMQKGSAAEKRRLVRELPDAEARVIGRQLDPQYQPEERQDLVSFFQNHYMPRNSWAGYDEDQKLSMAQAKEINRLEMDPNDAGPMYHNQYRAGLRHPLSVGPFDYGNITDGHEVKNALYDLLGDHVDGLDINVRSSKVKGKSTVHTDLQQDRLDDYTDYMNNNRSSI